MRGLGAMPFAVGGVADHVHLVAGLKATHAVADFVREIKKNASGWASEHRQGFHWQTGYGAFSFGYRDLDATIRYVANQEEHHRKLTSTQELLNLLEEFGVTYDAQYFE